MGSFFKSDIVREELEQINSMQEEIYSHAMRFPTMSRQEKLEHIEQLTELLLKQKIMYTRVSLSDDPEALQIKENIVNAAKMLGVPGEVDPATLFDTMHQTISGLRVMIRQQLDD